MEGGARRSARETAGFRRGFRQGGVGRNALRALHGADRLARRRLRERRRQRRRRGQRLALVLRAERRRNRRARRSGGGAGAFPRAVHVDGGFREPASFVRRSRQGGNASGRDRRLGNQRLPRGQAERRRRVEPRRQALPEPVPDGLENLEKRRSRLPGAGRRSRERGRGAFGALGHVHDSRLRRRFRSDGNAGGARVVRGRRSARSRIFRSAGRRRRRRNDRRRRIPRELPRRPERRGGAAPRKIRFGKVFAQRQAFVGEQAFRPALQNHFVP